MRKRQLRIDIGDIREKTRISDPFVDGPRRAELVIKFARPIFDGVFRQHISDSYFETSSANTPAAAPWLTVLKNSATR
jgi:hypothetical protein